MVSLRFRCIRVRQLTVAAPDLFTNESAEPFGEKNDFTSTAVPNCPFQSCKPSTQLQRRSYQSGNSPIAHGMRPATIQALDCCELGGAVRTDSLQFEHVEHLPALPARPEVSQRRRRLAPGTSTPVATRQL